MIRPALLLLSLSSAPAAAQYYRAEPVTPPAQERFVGRDSVWRCSGGICAAERGGSRPAIVCAALARQLGALRSFSAGQTAFSADQLETCNRRAR